MSTVKITQLPELTVISGNTSNTILVGVDLPSGVTTKYTIKAIADGMYANNVLNVGNNAVIFPGVIGQFVANNDTYLQLNVQNLDGNGSGDLVVTADVGTDTEYFIDMGIQGSNLDQGVLNPLDGYVVIQGAESTDPGANLVIGTLTPNKNITFAQGGYNESNTVAQFIYNTGFKLLKKPLIFADGSTQNTSSEGAVAYANGAFIKANAAFIQANTSANNAAGASLYANGAFIQANAAYTKANSALANTTGTLDGDLTITGNLQINYSTHIHKPDMTGNGIFLLITGSSTGDYGVPSNPGYTIQTVSPDGEGNRIVAEAYSNTASGYASFIGRRGRGTAANPLPIQNGDIIARFGGNAYGTTKFSQFGDGRIEVVATETHIDTSKATKIRFLTTESGTNSATEIASFNGNTATFVGTIEPTKGFIYTPNVSSTTTTKTISFVNDNLIKFDVNDNATITLGNYVAGKVVEVWITNSAAQNKTITHGCLANNSTSKATTFTILSSSCAYLRYFSIDGDQANTFVSITA